MDAAVGDPVTPAGWALGAALAASADVPVVVDGEVTTARLTVEAGEADAPIDAPIDAPPGLRAAAALVALERGDAWTGRRLRSDRELAAAGSVVFALDLLRAGATLPSDLAVAGTFLADGSLVPTAADARAIPPLVRAGRTRLVVPPALAGPARKAGAEVVIAHHLSEATARVSGIPWEDPAPTPPLPAEVMAEVGAELARAAGRVGEVGAWKLPPPLAHALTDRLREARRADGSAAAWWTWLDAEALPYAWTLTLRALGGDTSPAAVRDRFVSMAAAMDARLERHLRGPSDPVPAARAGLAHGLIMERARAACEAETGEAIGDLLSLAEAQARAELGSLYITDAMIRRAEVLVPHEAAQAAALLWPHGGAGCLGALAARVGAALDGSAWTSVDAAYAFGWLLAQEGPDDDDAARAAAERAVAEAVAAGLPCDAERLELAAVDDAGSLRAIALRARVGRLVLRAPR